MGELLPTLAARSIRDGLLEYLETTFALSDQSARLAMAEFLEHPSEGIFKGPYLRLRLPFRPAADGWRDALDWHPLDEGKGFAPYGHQAEAFARLSSARPRSREAAPAADARHDRHRVGQDRGVPVPDPRPRPARQGARRRRDEGADPLPDERARQRPGAAPRGAHHDASVARRRHRRPVHRPERAPSARRSARTA